MFLLVILWLDPFLLVPALLLVLVFFLLRICHVLQSSLILLSVFVLLRRVVGFLASCHFLRYQIHILRPLACVLLGLEGLESGLALRLIVHNVYLPSQDNTPVVYLMRQAFHLLSWSIYNFKVVIR